MKKYILLATLVFVFTFASCVKKIQPPDENNQTLLIIPVDAENKSGQPYGFYYTWTVANGDLSDTDPAIIASINITPKSNKYTFFHGLKPGKYRIYKTRLAPIKRSPGYRYNYSDKPENILFELEANKATILTKKLKISQVKEGFGFYTRHRIQILDDSFLSQLKEDLKEDENFNLWELKE